MDYLENFIRPEITEIIKHDVQTLSIDMDSILVHSAEKAWSYGSFEIKMSEDEQKSIKHHIVEKEFNKLVTSSLINLIKQIAPEFVLVLSLSGVVPAAEMKSLKEKRYRRSQLNSRDRIAMLTAGTDFMYRTESMLQNWIHDNRNLLPDEIYVAGHMTPGESVQKIVQFMRRRSKTKIFREDDVNIIYTNKSEAFLNFAAFDLKNVYVHNSSLAVGKNISMDGFRNIVSDAMGNTPTAIEDFIFLFSLVGNNYIPRANSSLNITNFMDNIITEYKKRILPLITTNKIMWNNVLFFLEMMDEHNDNEYRDNWYASTLGNLSSDQSFTITPDMIIEMCTNYLYGLEWSYRYIAEGSEKISIGWSYGYNSSPLLSDISKVLSTLIDKNTLPNTKSIIYPHIYPNVVHQLVAVIPPFSHTIKQLPKEVIMMTEISSPILDTFPHTVLIDQATDKAILPIFDLERIVFAVNSITIFSRERENQFKPRGIIPRMSPQGVRRRVAKSHPIQPVHAKQRVSKDSEERKITTDVLNMIFHILPGRDMFLSVVGVKSSMSDINIFWTDKRISQFIIYIRDRKLSTKTNNYIRSLPSIPSKTFGILDILVVPDYERAPKLSAVIYFNNITNVDRYIRDIGDKADLFVVRVMKKYKLNIDSIENYTIFKLTDIDTSVRGSNYIFILPTIEIDTKALSQWKGVEFITIKQHVPEQKSLEEIKLDQPVVAIVDELVEIINHIADLLLSEGKDELNIIEIYPGDGHNKSLFLNDKRVKDVHTYQNRFMYEDDQKSQDVKSANITSTVTIVFIDRENSDITELDEVENLAEDILNGDKAELVVIKTSLSYPFDNDRFEFIEEIGKIKSKFFLISSKPLYVTALNPNEFGTVDFHGEILPAEVVNKIDNAANHSMMVMYDHNSELVLEDYENLYPDDHRTALHLEQRKILMSDIYFISKYGDKSIDILYVSHTSTIANKYMSHLLDQFEEINKIYIYMSSDEELKSNVDIVINNTFKDDDVVKWSKYAKPFLFICDADMFLQQRWYEKMKENPNLFAAMLKFDINHSDESEYYVGNEIFFQCWNSLEPKSKIVVTNTPESLRIRKYNVLHYTKTFHYLNDIIREWKFFNHLVQIGRSDTPFGLDHCYDCALEVRIWAEYLDSRDESVTSRKIAKLITDVTDLSSEMKLYHPPHGEYPNTMMINKRRKLISQLEVGK
uniref:XRN 5'-3' exonuclease n=1 Tax=Pithovirus LCPAC404 TaxID=2506597 RepID=A0A481ZCE7_9VIRU|nr:MAG: XRN 5'-3' exonuclease [Pithovirus LCPAC404]